MADYKHVYKDVFKNPKNYSDRKYHANGIFNKCPIFIGGSGRSGTTIIARTLSQHPDTLNFVEVRFLLLKGRLGLHDQLPYIYRNEKIYNKIINGLKVAGYRNANKVYSKRVLDNIFTNDASTAIKRFFEIGLLAWNKSVIIEKTPHTFLVVDKLFKIFPNIRYIHTFRDPRDIFASVKSLQWGPDNAYEFVTWYNRLMSRAYDIKNIVPRKNYLIVRLEDLVENKQVELRYIFKFVNLKFNNSYKKMIRINNAHINRYMNDLKNKEINIVWSGCKDEYLKWKRLYNKERNKGGK